MAIDEGTAFARLVLALRPYLADLVFIGGWAHRLFRLHPLSQRLDFVPLLTQDVDLAVRGGLAARERDLRELLLKAGFTERFLGEDRPPITHYQLGDHEPFYVEFLTPRIGGPARRNGTSNATEDVAGVTAQRLRHLDVLLVAPWSILVEPSDFPIGPKVLEVRIANATSYISQKLLVLLNRRPPDRAKDVLYIHDTLVTFGRSLPELKQIWLDQVLPSLHPAAVRKLREAPRTLFSRVKDFTQDASGVARNAGRPVSAEEITAVCFKGLTDVLA